MRVGLYQSFVVVLILVDFFVLALQTQNEQVELVDCLRGRFLESLGEGDDS